MKKKLTFKIWLLIIFLVFSIISIYGIPFKFLEKGVVVTQINSESQLFEQGMRQGDIITQIDGVKINSLEEYRNVIESKFTGDEIRLEIKTKNNEYILITSDFPDISVGEIPKSNLKFGLDLAGGSRAKVKAANRSLTTSELNDLVDITANRLNAFGLTDLKVSPSSDLFGEKSMTIEIAGATPEDLEKLISEQGKFEAKIGNETVFIGGNRDIASVGRNAQTSRIESCGQTGDGSYACRFSFAITLSAEAAQRHADITSNLSINTTSQGNYLSEKLDLILDDQLMDSLLISEGLKGRVETQISISGSGEGETQEDAYNDAKEEMKRLQTILMTGSLPYKLEIVKLDTISPTLGKEFMGSILLAGLVAILVVALVIFFRYKSWKSSLALIATTVSEVVLILGIAAFIKWNLDLPGIAGILATIGTGIDDLVILLDESTSSKIISLKERIKRAFSIILGAYFTTFVSMLPLIWAGAGLLKGFAITTIIGISVGVLITRPAFSDFVKLRRD